MPCRALTYDIIAVQDQHWPPDTEAGQRLYEEGLALLDSDTPEKDFRRWLTSVHAHVRARFAPGDVELTGAGRQLWQRLTDLLQNPQVGR